MNSLALIVVLAALNGTAAQACNRRTRTQWI